MLAVAGKSYLSYLSPRLCLFICRSGISFFCFGSLSPLLSIRPAISSMCVILWLCVHCLILHLLSGKQSWIRQAANLFPRRWSSGSLGAVFALMPDILTGGGGKGESDPPAQTWLTDRLRFIAAGFGRRLIHVTAFSAHPCVPPIIHQTDSEARRRQTSHSSRGLD